MAAFFLGAVYFLAAAAGFSGYYSKYGFREGQDRFSFALMVDGQADRPFVYRRLLPEIANAAERLLPPAVDEALARSFTRPSIWLPQYFTRGGLWHGEADQAAYAVRYHAVYYLAFLSFFAALFLIRSACLAAGASAVGAACAPVVFALAFPFLEAQGGYFYDPPEVLFLFAAITLVLRAPPRWLWALIPLSLVATLNKEAFLFFVAGLSPLVFARLRPVPATLLTLLSLAACAAVYLLLREHYAANPGSAVELKVSENIRYYLNPGSLLTLDSTYGLMAPPGYSIATLVLVAALVATGWRRLPLAVRRHALLMAIINFPLFLVLGHFGEVRNLSLLYPALTFLIAQAVTALGTPAALSAAAGTAKS